MKKWLIITGIALIIVISLGYVLYIYLVIPRPLNITAVAAVKSSPKGTHRFLTDTSRWRNWWPGTNSGNTYSFRGYNFKPQQSLPHGIDVLVALQDSALPGRIIIIPIQQDSINLVWKSVYPSGDNPFEHRDKYYEAVDLRNNFDSILLTLKAYVENSANIYGYNIQQTSTTDTLLMAARGSSTTYPSLQDVYKLVNQLKDYIVTNGAQQTGYPMLNVTPTTNQFQFQVAVPVNKMLPDKGIIFSRRMVPGNFMTLEARGGLKAIDHAMRQMQQYAMDYQRTSMAIPFQVMITDRIKEQDTTKWITRIYYPVM